MKVIMLLSILFLSCSKDAAVKSDSFVLGKQKASLEIPSNLEEIPLQELELLTKRVARSEAEVRTGPIKNCLLQNQKKESIPLCLALWSTQNQYDSDIEKYILAQIHSSRVHALAAILRAYSLESVSLQLLLETLQILDEEEAWVRGKLISRWLRDHKREQLSFPQQDQLMQAAWPEESDSPYSFAMASSVILRIRGNKLSEILNPYCRSDVEGIALHRCWRVVAAMLQNETQREERGILISHFHSRNDHNWKLFRLNFSQFKNLTQGDL